jgi:hypothetical protein
MFKQRLRQFRLKMRQKGPEECKEAPTQKKMTVSSLITVHFTKRKEWTNKNNSMGGTYSTHVMDDKFTENARREI